MDGGGLLDRGRLEGDETLRRRFRGEVEVNGMLLVPAERGVDLVATVTETQVDGMTTTTARLHRDRSTRIVVDPLIGGARRRITLYTGTIDLAVADGLTIHEGPGARDPLARASAVDSEQIELPLSGTASLLELRVRDAERDIEGSR